jgi:hypothetical protein
MRSDLRLRLARAGPSGRTNHQHAGRPCGRRPADPIGEPPLHANQRSVFFVSSVAPFLRSVVSYPVSSASSASVISGSLDSQSPDRIHARGPARREPCREEPDGEQALAQQGVAGERALLSHGR